MKKDDATIDPSTAKQVRKYADLLLKKAGAYGRFPTPISELVEASKLEVAREQVLDEVYLGSIYRRLPNWMKLAPDRIKRALEKVVGVLDRPGRTIHLDPSLHRKKVPFVTIHEVGHDFLPWQRQTYDILEDSKSELEPETHDRFEREVNCFSSDVLFQLDRFTAQAADFEFGIKTPITLSGQYGTSIYSALRRYVDSNTRPCALIVFDKDEVFVAGKPAISLRRAIASKSFTERFGDITWPETAALGSFFYANKPRNKFTAATACSIRDANGNRIETIAEAFDSSFQIFFLLYPLVDAPRRSTLILSTR